MTSYTKCYVVFFGFAIRSMIRCGVFFFILQYDSVIDCSIILRLANFDTTFQIYSWLKRLKRSVVSCFESFSTDCFMNSLNIFEPFQFKIYFSSFRFRNYDFFRIDVLLWRNRINRRNFNKFKIAQKLCITWNIDKNMKSRIWNKINKYFNFPFFLSFIVIPLHLTPFHLLTRSDKDIWVSFWMLIITFTSYSILRIRSSSSDTFVL